MVDVDLLGGFVSGPTIASDDVDDKYFSQYFWGEKNQGFGVLYHNMKHGLPSAKSLQEFVRESANSEDLYAKHLTKLAKQAANSSSLGTFAPMFDVFKVMSEKLSSCHMDVVHKFHEIIKDLSKYFDEQKGKHKQVKDEVSKTADALHVIQSTTTAVQKSKEKYYQLCVEAERLRRANALGKDIEKADLKSKKASEDYRTLVEKYANVRNDYEEKMTSSAERFQEIEVGHLKHMKSVLDSYILSYENANVLISQVHQEFRKQVNDHTIESLIKRYSETKGTGTEKPAPIVFEECDVNSMLISVDSANTNGVSTDDATSIPAPNKTTRIINNLPFRRKKPRHKPPKENAGSKETESIESPDKEGSVKIDDEGYTIRPETPKESKRSWGFDSSDESGSDSDDALHRKIHVKIKPKEKSAVVTDENNLDALNAITRNLTLNSATALGGKKLVALNDIDKRQSDSSIEKSEKSSSDDILALFNNSDSKPAPKPSVPAASNNNSAILDLFDNKSASPPESLFKTSVPQSSSSNSLSNLFVMPDKDNDEELSELKANRPGNLSLSTNAWSEPMKATNTAPPLASSESWSSLSSVGGTPMESFASSRGPSPVTLAQGDPIPIAVAFTETVNAYFKGSDGNKCMLKISGEIQISFPAGIVRAFASNPNPAALSFRLKGSSKLQDVVPNKTFLCTLPSNEILLQCMYIARSDSTQSPERLFWFEMSSLTSHIKKMTDASPNAPYYNIPVLSYELSSQSGHSMAPLHLTSNWKCDVDTTDVTIEYKYNSIATSSSLKNVQVILPVDGGVASAQSTPTATWVASQNRLLWKISSPVSGTSPAGTLSGKLSLTSGPTRSKSLAVQFVSEGATLTGSDFELTGSGYRLSLVKKRYTSGKYLLDGS